MNPKLIYANARAALNSAEAAHLRGDLEHARIYAKRAAQLVQKAAETP